MRIVIVGLGLIGGSMAKALKAFTPHTVTGIDLSSEVTAAALRDGAIDAVGDETALLTADVVILALHPRQTVEFVLRNQLMFHKCGIVIDTCGVKRMVCDKIAPIAEENGFVFVGGHPMAGKEHGGYENSSADLFEGASFILTPCRVSEVAVILADELMRSLGFGKIVHTTPQRHDEMIAYTSQLPHLLACAYILDPNAPFHSGFSAGSFRDVSRVATVNEQLWSQLFLENSENLTVQLDRLIDNLLKLKTFIAQSDAEALSSMLAKGRKIKEEIAK